MLMDVVEVSRLQFALTALVHFLFVPLTLGLSALLAIMDTVYAMTGRAIWKKMTQYWGILFGINFAMGVATGLTMEFQFGTNWGYYSHYVGDIFGVPLAIEGLMAFFLEATFIGLFFFGWNRLSRLQHMIVTWLVAFGTNFSALWILIANGWMQNPAGAKFDFETMRMQVTSFSEVFFNPVAQAKFVHTVSAGYITGSFFVMAVSCYFLLQQRNREFARRSITVAASFGLASALSVVVLGDESGYAANANQKLKLAAIESMWEPEPAPAPLVIAGWPNQKEHRTDYAIKVPYVLGLIATRSFDQPVMSITEIVGVTQEKIRSGIKALQYVERLKKTPHDRYLMEQFRKHEKNIGFGLLAKAQVQDINHVNQATIEKVAWETVPKVWPLFWGFRIMAGLGFLFIFMFAIAFYYIIRRQIVYKRWFHYVGFYALPLPWIAAELGWFIAEYGRQPWVIEGILPTRLAVSSVSTGMVWSSLIALMTFYLVLFIAEMFLMIKYVRLGPDGLTLIGEKA